MPLSRHLDSLAATLQGKGIIMKPHLRQGIPRTIVQSVLSSIGLTPPNELYELYEWHDGVDILTAPALIFGEHQFLSLSDALQEYHELNTYYADVVSSINFVQCFPVASFQGSTWNVYCKSTPVEGLLYPIIEVHHGVAMIFESVELMVLTAIEWFSSGVYDKDPIDDDLRLAIRRRMNSRIPARTTTL